MGPVSEVVAPFLATTRSELVVVVIEAVCVAVLLFFYLAPLWKRLIFKNVESFNADVCSDIPGNPHVFDFSVISALRTLPEPNNCNMIWTKIPFDRDVIIQGYMPPARMCSVSLYNAGGSVPQSEALTNPFYDNFERKYYRVLMTKNPDQAGSDKFDSVVFTKDWKEGMVVVRNYLIPPGTVSYSPEIVDRATGKVLRESQLLIAGAANIHINDNLSERVLVISLHVLAVWALNIFLFSKSLNRFWQLNLLFAGLTFIFIRAIYSLLYQIGKRRVAEIFHNGIPSPHTFKLVDVENKSHDSAPSRLHRYFVMRYDLSVGSQLKMEMRVKPELQDYWSCVVYDEYGIPLPNLLFDLNAKRTNIAEDSYGVEFSLVNRGKSGPFALAGAEAMGTQNEIDIAASPKGYILLRFVHPKDEATTAYSTPKVVGLQQLSAGKRKKND